MCLFPSNHFVSTAADAILIAGILALAVDPWLKRELLDDASREVFIHLLGFEHHPQVKDKLKEMAFETKLLRTLRMAVTVEHADDGYWVTVKYDTDIIDSTNVGVPYIRLWSEIRRTSQRCSTCLLHPLTDGSSG
jgi:hypothetical protein